MDLSNLQKTEDIKASPINASKTLTKCAGFNYSCICNMLNSLSIEYKFELINIAFEFFVMMIRYLVLLI